MNVTTLFEAVSRSSFLEFFERPFSIEDEKNAPSQSIQNNTRQKKHHHEDDYVCFDPMFIDPSYFSKDPKQMGGIHGAYYSVFSDLYGGGGSS